MSFMDKMKLGLNQVKDKAQQTVEATRLSAQISGKKKEKTAQYTHLGEMVHRASLSDTLQDQLQHIAAISKIIRQIDMDIEGLELQLLQLKGEKTCACGAVVPFDSRFCNSCGQLMQGEADSDNGTSAPYHSEPMPEKHCGNCGTQIDWDSKFCVACGTKAE